MKKLRMMWAIALLAPGLAAAQSTFETGIPYDNKVVGMVPLQCDATGKNCRALSGANPQVTAGKQETFALVAANTPSSAATVYGGYYTLTQACTVYGSLTLRYRGPDGSTMLTMFTKTAADSGGGTLLSLAGGQVVDVTLTGTTGCNAQLGRNPQ